MLRSKPLLRCPGLAQPLRSQGRILVSRGTPTGPEPNLSRWNRGRTGGLRLGPP